MSLHASPGHDAWCVKLKLGPGIVYHPRLRYSIVAAGMCVRLAPEQNEEVRKKFFRISLSRHRKLGVPYQKERLWTLLANHLPERQVVCRVVDCHSESSPSANLSI